MISILHIAPYLEATRTELVVNFQYAYQNELYISPLSKFSDSDGFEQHYVLGDWSENSLTETPELIYNALRAILCSNDQAIPRFDILELKAWNQLKLTEALDASLPYVLVNTDTLFEAEQYPDIKELLRFLNKISHVHFLDKKLLKNSIKHDNQLIRKVFAKLFDQGRITVTNEGNTTQIDYQQIYLNSGTLTSESSEAISGQLELQIKTQQSLNVMHVALEYGQATLGGLGSVATQMVDAQNQASIITPYYPLLFTSYTNPILETEVEHLHNGEHVKSEILLQQNGHNKHYMVNPTSNYNRIFSINSVNSLYNDLHNNYFIDRVKYLNSAVAAYIHNHSATDIIVLHDWQAALVPKLLSEFYRNIKVKTVFLVHVSNIDCGAYSHQQLAGIGLHFSQGYHLLKAVGLKSSDKIVAVSPSFLRECVEFKGAQPETDELRKIFVLSTTTEHKATAILNGFNYNKFCHPKLLSSEPNMVYNIKLKLKHELARQINIAGSKWNINPDLPIILYIGRFSAEKGIDTFAQVIDNLKTIANFIALGRGATKEIVDLINTHAKRSNNLLISYDPEDQIKYGALIRGAADFTFVPSHREACGLGPMEGFANGSLCITSGVGGLVDSVSQFTINAAQETTGNGFLYADQTDGKFNQDLHSTLLHTMEIWQNISPQLKNLIQLRIIEQAKSFDWLAPNGAMTKYLQIFNDLASESKSISSKQLMAPI